MVFFADEMALFRAHVTRALGPQVRILRDGEGWPVAPGRLGRLEWRGAEWATGEHRLYAYTDRARIITKLRALPGVPPQQIGDAEAAFWVRADDAPAMRAVASLLRLRQRRGGGGGRGGGGFGLVEEAAPGPG